MLLGQHVACDACKLRRIKCDLVNLLPSRLDDPGNEHLPSFREQVRRHPEVQCANCVKKELICSTEAIRNPAPPKKTGRMIDKLRERSQRSQQGWTGQGPLEEMEDSSESDDEYDDAPERSGSRGKQPLEPNQSREQLLAELLDSRAGRDEMAAYASWRSMIENLPSVTANAPALPLPATVHLDDITIGHGSRGHGAIVAPASSINVSAPFSSWMTSGTGAHCPSTVPVRYADSFGIGVYGRSMEAESSTSHSRKRRFGGLGQVLELSGEPREWHLWSREDSLVVWGRREIVQERLADRALGMELSRHLISMYFQVVHHAFPVSYHSRVQLTVRLSIPNHSTSSGCELDKGQTKCPRPRKRCARCWKRGAHSTLTIPWSSASLALNDLRPCGRKTAPPTLSARYDGECSVCLFVGLWLLEQPG